MSARRTESRRRIYVDPSAYLRILLSEDGAEELVRELDDAELVSSVLLFLEVSGDRHGT
jgi:hypothetical protein